MELVKIDCPYCSGFITVNEDAETCYCTYCGRQIGIKSGTKKIKIHITDDARIKEAETAKDIRLKEIEQKDKESMRNHRYTIWPMLFLIVLLAAMPFLLSLENYFSDNAKRKLEQQSIEQGMIHAGYSGDYEKMNYEAAVQQLEALGFTNIEVIDLKDAGILHNKKDTIESISIDGDTYFSSGDFFDPDAKIIITYH